MENILLLILCFLLGIVLRRWKRFPEGAPAALNAYVINIALPALALLHIHELPFDRRLVVAALMPWVVFGVGAAFFRMVGRRMGLERRTIGCLMLVGGLGNTSFVGLPMVEAFYGKDALGTAILADQTGTFLALATAGLLVAARYSASDLTARQVALRVLRFPPFIAMALAFLLIPLPYPPIASHLLARLGDTLAPLALVSVGLQLEPSHLRGNGAKLGVGLLYKMALAPALILLLLGLLPGMNGQVAQVTVFEAAMAPMITGGIVAMEHDLDPPLAALMLGIGIPLSFVTLPVWYWVIGMFGVRS